MPEGLKLKVSGDITELEKTLNKMVSDAGTKGKAAGQALSNGINTANKTIQKVPVVAKQAQLSVSKLGDSLETLRAKLLAKREFLVTEKDIVKVGVLNREIKALEAEIVRVQTIGASGVNLGGVGTAASKGFSFLRQAAYLLPGIGIAGLLGGISDAIVGMVGFGKATDEATQKVRDLIKSTSLIAAEAGADTAGEAAKVNALVKIVQDQTKSYQERNRALSDLKEINKTYFGDLTLEAASLQLLTQRANEYTKALIQQAVIKSFQDEIGKVSVAMVNQRKRFTDAQKSLIDFNNAQKQATKGGKDFSTALLDAEGAAAGISGQATQQRDLISTFEKEEGLLRDLSKQYGELQTAIEGAVLESLKFKPLDDKKTGSSKKTTDELQKVISKAKEVADYLKPGFIITYEFSPLDTKQEAYNKAKAFLDDVAANRIKMKPFTTEISIQIPPESEVQAVEEITRFQEAVQKGIDSKPPVEVNIPFNINADSLLSNDRFKNILNNFQKIGLKPPSIDIDLNPDLNISMLREKLVKYFGVASDISDAALQKLVDTNAKAIESVNNILASVSVDSIANIGDIIGNAISGNSKGLQDAFKNIGNILAGGFSAIGKQMIAAAPIITALQAAIKSLNPAILLPAGIALVGIGAALKSSIGNGIKGFAEGGLVYGPTMGLVGEGVGTTRSNPEVIAPLDQLRNMIASEGGGGVLRTTLRGNDLALAVNRTNRRNSRLGG